MRIRNDKERLHDLLQVSGVRPTKQRLVLASILFDGKLKHMTAEAVHEAANKQDINVSLATVYNTLHCFTAAGLLREISVDAPCNYFDTNVSEHCHLYDEVSGELMDLPPGLVRLVRVPRMPQGRQIGRMDVTIRLVAKDNPLKERSLKDKPLAKNKKPR